MINGVYIHQTDKYLNIHNLTYRKHVWTQELDDRLTLQWNPNVPLLVHLKKLSCLPYIIPFYKLEQE